MIGGMDRTFAVNGLDLFVRDSAPDSGAAETLLLLHGFTGSGSDWQHVFSQPPSGYRVIAPDLRGHGQSTNPSGSFTFREVARDILALLDHLAIDRVKAIGMSAGANTLLHMATQQPARIDAMIHVSGTPRFPDEARAMMRAMPVDGVGRYAHQLAGDRDDMNFTASTLSAITARTLIVHGDRDPLYPVELAVELYRGIPGSSLWVVPQGGHGPIFGEQAAPFVEAATSFFRA
jgi:pimeloyl-ACP methyl ester carboxylesterase